MKALVDTFSSFVTEGDKHERAVFDAAMVERLKTERYTVADVMYDVFLAQKGLALLQIELEAVKAKLCSCGCKAPAAKAKGK